MRMRSLIGLDAACMVLLVARAVLAKDWALARWAAREACADRARDAFRADG
jgi:hypothetical protein